MEYMYVYYLFGSFFLFLLRIVFCITLIFFKKKIKVFSLFFLS